MPRAASLLPCPPSGVAWRDGVFTGRPQPLRWAIARPESGAAADLPPILLLHGRTECVEKYAEVLAELCGRGRIVATFDWRGQGRSGREAVRGIGHIRRFEDYLDDLDALRAGPFAELGGSFDVIAHSMGGHLALLWAARRPEAVRRMVLSAPMIDLRFSGLKRRMGRAFIAAVCALGGGVRPMFRHHHLATDAAAADWFPGNPLTGDRARYDAWAGFNIDHPEIALDGGSFGWVRAAFRSIDQLRASAPVDAPTLFVWGDDERIVLEPAIAAAAARAPNASALRIAGARHEPMMETDAVRAQFWAGFDAFMR